MWIRPRLLIPTPLESTNNKYPLTDTSGNCGGVMDASYDGSDVCMGNEGAGANFLADTAKTGL